MQTTKLIFTLMIGLAMIDFSTGQSLNAATNSATRPVISTSAKHPVATTLGKSSKTMDGVAAVYSDTLSGRKTASGQTFSQENLTAAHRSLPLGTKVLVTNIRNRRSVEVRINDRGPWHPGRIIDLSGAAAEKIGIRRTGKTLVKLEIVNPTSATSKREG